MATNVPPIVFTPTGLSLPADSDILAGVQADINEAFGGDVNPALETPQGQLASSEAAIISDKNSQIAYMANQVDPAFSAGRWQDAIGRIYYITRIPGQGTVVTATCSGLTGTVIPAGSLAKDLAGNIYSCSQDGVIPDTGSVDLQFTCSTLGPISCPISNLTKIYQNIIGWDSITNASAGILGRLVETRDEFEYRRKNSVAVNSQGSIPSIRGAVLAVSGVTDAYVYENLTNGTVNVGATSYSMIANSIYVGVVGGTSADIAAAILSKKSPGASMNGSTSVTVYDYDYDYPQPSYVVKYKIPAGLPVKFAVQIQANPNVPANISDLVKSAIVTAFNGQDGGTRARIGCQLVAGRFYSGVANTSSYTNVLSILMGTSTATLTSVTAGIDQIPTIASSDITVTIV